MADQPAATRGYAGFGSFHNEVPVAQMVLAAVPSIPPTAHGSAGFLQYDAAAVPRTSVLPGERLAPPASQMVGRVLAEANFDLHLRTSDDRQGWVFLNHGAFGAPFRHASECASRWRTHAERQPLRFFDRELFEHLVFAIQDVARYLDVEATHVALVSNATEALNAAMAGVPWRGDGTEEAVVLDIGYGGLKKALAVQCERVNATVRTVGILREDLLPGDSGGGAGDYGCCGDLEGDMPKLEAKLLAVIDPHKTRFVLLDHVTSNTAALLPVARLAQAVRRIAPDARIVVDGAHALGALRFTRGFWDALEADVYVTNAHKWLCGCRGSAVAIALSSRARDGELRPLISSHGAGAGFTSEFIWQGNKDYAPFLALPQVLAFHRTFGDAMARHQRALLRHAERRLGDVWDVQDVPLIPFANCHPYMACFCLPQAIQPVDATSTDAKAVQDALHERFGIECPVKALFGRLYVRVSAGPYSVEQDIEDLAQAVLELCGKSRNVLG